jgi:hypothetical protein
VDLGHKSAFDLLLKEAWNSEQAAMGNSTLPTICDKLNIMASIHNRKLLAALVRELSERDSMIEKFEERIVLLEDQGFLALRFFSWFSSNKNRVVLFYAFASATLTINAIFTLLFVTLSLEGRPQEVRPYTILSVEFSEDPLTLFLSNASTASFILSFILMWGATVSMMAHYAKRMGRTKYWIVVSIPLIYYSSQFLLPLINVYPTLLELGTISTTLLFTLIFTFSKPVGGILFGLACLLEYF